MMTPRQPGREIAVDRGIPSPGLAIDPDSLGLAGVGCRASDFTLSRH